MGEARDVAEPEVRSESENAGLAGKSNESLANIAGLSTSVECVGAGERGKVGASDNVVAFGDEAEGVMEGSRAAGETASEFDDGRPDEVIGAGLVEGGVGMLAEAEGVLP